MTHDGRRTAAAYPNPSSPAARAVMQGNRKTDTRPELTVRRALHAAGLRYRVNHAVTVQGVRVRPDVVFSWRKVAVFIDGCFWHGCPTHVTQPRANSDYWQQKLQRNRVRDNRTDALLRQAGWIVVRVWEHESSAAVTDLVKHALSDLDR
jgi:DNA mismatch endonuclease, patch repair protein